MSVIQMLDENLLMWIQRTFRVEGLDPLVKIFSSLGNMGFIWIIIGLLMIIWKPSRRQGLVTTLSLGFSVLITNIALKPFISRARPYMVIEELNQLVTSGDFNSFPSGHTSAAFAAGVVWVFLLGKPWLKVVALAQATLMGLSRLYLGVHYPTDVLGGMVIGSLCGVLALTIWKVVEEKIDKDEGRLKEWIGI